MVQEKDILSALEVMGVYLPDIETEAGRLTALVNALTVMQAQVKAEKDAAAAAELERQKQQQLAVQLEDKSIRIRMRADELIQLDEKLTPADALIQAAQIVKEEDTVALE